MLPWACGRVWGSGHVHLLVSNRYKMPFQRQLECKRTREMPGFGIKKLALTKRNEAEEDIGSAFHLICNISLLGAEYLPSHAHPEREWEGGLVFINQWCSKDRGEGWMAWPGLVTLKSWNRSGLRPYLPPIRPFSLSFLGIDFWLGNGPHPYQVRAILQRGSILVYCEYG